MKHITQQIHTLQAEISHNVQLVAVSKYHPCEQLQEAYKAGQRVFGESHVQEMVEKYHTLPQDIAWHFIGHLQTNKIKAIAPFVSLIHAVDSLRLLTEINKHALRAGRVIDCLIQLHVAQEQTKFGFTPTDCLDFFTNETAWRTLTNVRIRGLMCMASNTEDENIIAAEFDKASQLFHTIKQTFFANDTDFNIKSWGMTHDYSIAIAHGSNMVRIGTKIFGERT